MRSILCALSTITVIMLINVQAFATQATWVNNGHWDIQGYSADQFCQLNVHYERGEMLAIQAGKLEGGPAMGFSSRNLRPLTQNAEIVEASFTFSNGEFYQIVAQVLNPTLIRADVPNQAVIDFARAASMEVRVRDILVGVYNLAGTDNMVGELVRCAQVMKGNAF